MEEITHGLEELDRPLADLDVTPGGQVFLITEKGKGKEEKRQRLFINGQPLPVPRPIRHPILRALDEERFLLADARTGEAANAWILRTTGEVETTFWAGDAIEDVVPLQSWIAVTYFDQAYSNSLDGVVLFDANGKVAFRHNRSSGTGSEIVDCNCACRAGKDRLLFLGYPDFSITFLDAVTKQETFWPAPSEIRGAAAVTFAGGGAFFHSPYDDRNGIYRWRLGSQSAERIGEHADRLRGLPGGRFLSTGDTSYTILSLADDIK